MVIANAISVCNRRYRHNIDDRYSPDHPVVPCTISRPDTCGHFLHKQCACDLIIHRKGFWHEIAWCEDITEIMCVTPCCCGFESQFFTTADSSLEEFVTVQYDLNGILYAPFTPTEVPLLVLPPEDDNDVDVVYDGDDEDDFEDVKEGLDMDPDGVAEIEVDTLPLSWDELPHSCPYCDFEADVFLDIQIHLLTLHLITHQCQLRGLVMPTKDDIMQHLHFFHNVWFNAEFCVFP